MAQQEFVDLYALLDLARDADAGRIRKRINELYIEAQKNLDHRNPRKKLQFQQMYEIYLPQARHLLLDEARRAEYNRYLEAFLAGEKVDAGARPFAAPPPPRSETPGAQAKSRPTLTDPGSSPAEREQLWEQWKKGLENTAPPPKSPPASRPVSSPPAADADPFNFSFIDNASSGTAAPTATRDSTTPQTTKAPGATPQQAASRSASSQSAPSSVDATQQAAAQAEARRLPEAARQVEIVRQAEMARLQELEEIERQREEAAEHNRQRQRMLLIRSGVQLAGLIWQLGTGIAVVVIGLLIAYLLDTRYSETGRFPGGMSRGAFDVLSILISCGVAWGVSYFASRQARKQAIRELSMMSYEELMRRKMR